MEVNAAAAAEQTVTYITTDKSLARQVKEYMEATNTKISALANEIPGYSRPTISRYLSGKYEGDVSTVERLLADWLAKRKSEVVDIPERPKRAIQRPRFYESRDAKAVLGVCQSCQEYREMGIITGRSGFGKTYTLKEYSKLPRVARIECDVTMSPRDLLKELERALGIPTRSGTNRDRTNGIVDFLTINPGYLLIVDEADKLMSKYTYNKMEILRSIFDRCAESSDYSTCGLVVAGEPKLRAQIDTYLNQYVLAALGYEHSSIKPVYQQDPERWAEFIVDLGVGSTNAVKNFYAIFSEIQRVKEGSSRVAGIVFTMQPLCAILRLGGGVGAVVQLNLHQNADEYDFQQTIFAGGVFASKSSIGLPQSPDECELRATLYAGGTGSIHASAGVHESRDKLSGQDKISLGGKFSVLAKVPIPESPGSPPSTTILRTGGVCTIISNLSKGE